MKFNSNEGVLKLNKIKSIEILKDSMVIDSSNKLFLNFPNEVKPRDSNHLPMANQSATISKNDISFELSDDSPRSAAFLAQW